MKDIFQSTSFLSFIQDTGFLIPFHFSQDNNNVEACSIQGFIQKDGGIVKRFFSRRAIINGGPYLHDCVTSEDIKVMLQKCIKSMRHKTIYIETRNFHDFSRFRNVFEECGFTYEPHYDFVINTKTRDIAEENLGKSRKRDIKASIKNGATIVDHPSEKQIEDYYSILSDLYKTRVKTPLFPLEFFLKLSQESFSKFLLIDYKGEIIGGTVCIFDDETVYEWFACGKDGVYKNVHPSTLATWSGIEFAVETGHLHFDMMGAGAPGDNGYGVRDFKAKFGGDLVEYGRFRYICNKPLFVFGKLGVRFMKKK